MDGDERDHSVFMEKSCGFRYIDKNMYEFSQKQFERWRESMVDQALVSNDATFADVKIALMKEGITEYSSKVFKQLKKNIRKFQEKHVPLQSMCLCDEQDCVLMRWRVECSAECGVIACKNQRIRKREFVDSLLVRSQENRTFLTTTAEIAKESFLGEFLGEFCFGNVAPNQEFVYKPAMKNGIILDCSEMGNETRHILHSETPNSRLEEWMVDDFLRVIVVANEVIVPDQPITVKFSHCLVPPSNQASVAEPVKISNAKTVDRASSNIVTSAELIKIAQQDPEGLFRYMRVGSAGDALCSFEMVDHASSPIKELLVPCLSDATEADSKEMRVTRAKKRKLVEMEDLTTSPLRISQVEDKRMSGACNDESPPESNKETDVVDDLDNLETFSEAISPNPETPTSEPVNLVKTKKNPIKRYEYISSISTIKSDEEAFAVDEMKKACDVIDVTEKVDNWFCNSTSGRYNLRRVRPQADMLKCSSSSDQVDKISAQTTCTPAISKSTPLASLSAPEKRKEIDKIVANAARALANDKKRGIHSTRLACAFCPEFVTRDTFNYRRHLEEMHYKPKDVKCKNRSCSMMFNSEGKMKDHIKTHADEITRDRYKCTLCPRHYGRKSDWKKHISKEICEEKAGHGYEKMPLGSLLARGIDLTNADDDFDIDKVRGATLPDHLPKQKKKKETLKFFEKRKGLRSNQAQEPVNVAKVILPQTTDSTSPANTPTSPQTGKESAKLAPNQECQTDAQQEATHSGIDEERRAKAGTRADWFTRVNAKLALMKKPLLFN